MSQTRQPSVQRIHIDFVRILEIAHLGIRRASSFVALGLRVTGDDSIRSVRLDNNFHHVFMPDPLPEEDSRRVRENFGKWVVGNGLRELDQFFSVFLDHVYYALVRISAGGPLNAEATRRLKVNEQDTNLGSKLDRLTEEFGIESAAGVHIATLSQARNALTHNLGRVGGRHLNDGGALKVSWLQMEIVIGDQVIAGAFEPIHVSAGQEIQIRFSVHEKRFLLGQAIELSPTDISNICMMFHTEADRLVKAAEQFARDRGIPVSEPASAPNQNSQGGNS